MNISIYFGFHFLYPNHLSLSMVGWSIMEPLLLFCDYMQAVVAHVQWHFMHERLVCGELSMVNMFTSSPPLPQAPKKYDPHCSIMRTEGGYFGFFMFT
jgi:hypothetical protein